VAVRARELAFRDLVEEHLAVAAVQEVADISAFRYFRADGRTSSPPRLMSSAAPVKVRERLGDTAASASLDDNFELPRGHCLMIEHLFDGTQGPVGRS